MKHVVVTGANKGIGLAVVEATLREQPDAKVWLGARDPSKGEAARAGLAELDPSFAARVEVLPLDVSSDASVAEAARRAERCGEPLHAIVNNAGAITGRVAEVVDVNVHGIRRMCAAFAPLIARGGRVVNVTSASGPNFVARCDPQRQAFFTDPETSWRALDAFMQQCESEADLDAHGMGGGAAYGFSKACANLLTMILAKRHPDLLVNACTPGYIDTDLGRETLHGRTPAEAGMKRPADGARVILQLLFAEPRGRGWYFGSDGLRSPMDRYRAPGAPEYAEG